MNKLLLLLLITLGTIALSAVTMPYSQNFNDPSLPAGWSQSYSGELSADCWTVSPTNYAGGTSFEMMQSYQLAAGTSRLISPPLDTDGIIIYTISFLHLFDDDSAGVTAKVQYSHDLTTWYDTSWSVVSGYGDASGSVTTYVINMDNEPVTYLAWVVEGNHYQFDYWYVDSIQISAPLLHDVAALSINLPDVVNAEEIIPQATVTNNGLNFETFTVTIEIGGYTDTQEVIELPPSTNQTIYFEPYLPTAYAVQTMTVRTNLAWDESPNNDVVSDVLICLPLDVQVYADCAYDPSSVLDGPCTFNLKDPGMITDLPAANPFTNILTGADWINGVWKGMEFNSTGSPFWRIDPGTGAGTRLGTGAANLRGVTYDDIHKITYATDGTRLFTLSSTGVSTLIGTLHLSGETYWSGVMISLAYDDIAQVLYGVDIVYNRLFAINPANTLCTPKPQTLGMDIDFVQDLAFDREKGLLYLAGFTTTGALYWIDTVSGRAWKIGAFQGGAELTGFAIPWASLETPDISISDATISWSPIYGAVLYYICAADTPTGVYSVYATTTETTYQITNFPDLKKFFVIKAVNIPATRSATEISGRQYLKTHRPPEPMRPANAGVYSPLHK